MSARGRGKAARGGSSGSGSVRAWISDAGAVRQSTRPRHAHCGLSDYVVDDEHGDDGGAEPADAHAGAAGSSSAAAAVSAPPSGADGSVCDEDGPVSASVLEIGFALLAYYTDGVTGPEHQEGFWPAEVLVVHPGPLTAKNPKRLLTVRFYEDRLEVIVSLDMTRNYDPLRHGPLPAPPIPNSNGSAAQPKSKKRSRPVP